MSKKRSEHKTKQDPKHAMNDALKQWLTESDKEQLQKKIEHELEGKKPQGMCHVCGINPGKSICIKCGNSVCISCYYTIVGLCRKCLSKETVNQWKGKKPDLKTMLGVDWVD